MLWLKYISCNLLWFRPWASSWPTGSNCVLMVARVASGGHLTGNSNPPGMNKHPSSTVFHQSGRKSSFMGKSPTSDFHTPEPFSIQGSTVTCPRSFGRCLSKPSPWSWCGWSCKSAIFCVFLCFWGQEWIATRILEESYMVVGRVLA